MAGAAITVAACGQEPEPLVAGELASAARADHSGAPAASATDELQTITLITGDRVTLMPGPSAGPGRAVSVARGAGRAQIGYTTLRHGDDVYVLPRDVTSLVAGGSIDRELFNVTRLIAEGYGDAAMDYVPMLLTGDAGAVTAGLAASSLAVDRRMPSLGVVAIRQPKTSPGSVLATVRTAASIAAARAGGTGPKLWLDRKLKPALDHSVPQIGAPAAHARGFTGAGVTVAVLDSGIDDSHPDLAGVVIAAASFVADTTDAGDVIGHGTHVASIIAGSGAASGGRYRGVAPDARLINARVCARFCFSSDVLAGMEWAVVEQRAPVVNLSLGIADFPGIDPLEEAVNRLSAEHGALFVVAAGNDAEFGIPVESPASAEAALAVGAVDREGRLAAFSARGPTVDGGVIKPDLTAPGVAIVAARAGGVLPIGAPVDTAYQRLSGTSMAAPHAAGAAALLLQQHPEWTGAQLKAALLGAADPNPAHGIDEQGAGQLDIDRATRQHAAPLVSSVDAGVAQWPHADDPVGTRTLTYRNTGTAPITLDLTARLAHAGASAPPGMIQVSPTSLTIAAGATAQAMLEIDTRAPNAPDGRYTGAVIATADDHRVITPVAVVREVESHELTIRTLDRDGNDQLSFVVLVARDPTGRLDLLDVFGTHTMRLPRESYVVHSLPDPPVMLAYPGLVLDRDTVITFDDRAARPIEVRVPGVPLTFGLDAAVSWDMLTNFSIGRDDLTSQLLTAHIGPAASAYRSAVMTSGVPTGSDVVQPPVGDPDFYGFADPYAFMRQETGRMVTGWRATVARHQLTTVDSSAVGDPPTVYRKFLGGLATGDTTGATSLSMWPGDYAPNVHRTEHLYGEGITWFGTITRNDLVPPFPFEIRVGHLRAVRRYLPGQHYVERYFVPPLGPALAQRIGRPAAFRQGDHLEIEPSMFSDRASPSRESGIGVLRRFRFLRDGVTLVDVDDYILPPAAEVPPGAATYRFETEHVRNRVVNGQPLFDLSTRTFASWTFRSAHEPGPTAVPLTLPTLRFAPELDNDGRAPHAMMIVPATIEWSSGAPPPRVARVTVEVSFDDALTWSRIPGVLFGDRWLGLVAHPPGAEYASLRGSVRDTLGQESTVEILHAYRLAKK